MSKPVPNIKLSHSVSDGAVGEAAIRVLHVDDDEGLLECAKELLRLYGDFEVTVACGVDKALEILKDGCFDVVVSDYEMPARVGWIFCDC